MEVNSSNTASDAHRGMHRNEDAHMHAEGSTGTSLDALAECSMRKIHVVRDGFRCQKKNHLGACGNVRDSGSFYRILEGPKAPEELRQLGMGSFLSLMEEHPRLRSGSRRKQEGLQFSSSSRFSTVTNGHAAAYLQRAEGNNSGLQMLE
eukprot:806045-Pelagomonas_calceolata.AAC.4